MKLKAKQGRNQKGLSFILSKESEFKSGVYYLSHKMVDILADVRVSTQVPEGYLIIDRRIFDWLSCDEASDIIMTPIDSTIPSCEILRLSVKSTKGIESQTIADILSKRINDLQDDLEGLVLQKGQTFLIQRLGIQFTVLSLSPNDPKTSAARISWRALKKIHLEPIHPAKAFNLCCVVEVAAASHIADVTKNTTGVDTENIPRYEASLEALKQIALSYSGYGSAAQFSGLIYSDDVIAYQQYDSKTGNPTEISPLYSESLLLSFIEWIRMLINEHKNITSNPGVALQEAFKKARELSESNGIPSVILFFSSGAHSSGPNPLKIAKKFLESVTVPIICFSFGQNANQDLMNAIADISKGVSIGIRTMSEMNQVVDEFETWSTSGGY